MRKREKETLFCSFLLTQGTKLDDSWGSWCENKQERIEYKLTNWKELFFVKTSCSVLVVEVKTGKKHIETPETMALCHINFCR